MEKYQEIKVSELEFFKIRDIREDVIEKLERRIKEDYNPARPLSVVKNNDSYIVADGNHRLKVLQELNVEKVPCVVYKDADPYNLAVECNQDEDTYAPLDLFDWLDIIDRLKNNCTQKEIANKIGWSVSKVKQYSALLNKIKVTKVLDIAKKYQKGRVTSKVTNVTFNFTEGWFRTIGIYDLDEYKQLEFIEWFCDDKNCKPNKSKVKSKIKELLLRQKARKYLQNNLHKKADGSDIIDNIDKGLYKNIKQVKQAVKSLNEQIIEKEKIQILNKDAFDMLQDLPDNSVNAIITDPPYNVTDNDWDKFNNDNDFLNFIEKIIVKSKRVLKDKYHFYLFTADKYMADIEMIFRKHNLSIQSRIIWVRKNMSMGRTTDKKYISHYEPVFHIGNKSLNFPNDWGEERFNIQEFAVPQSNFDDKKEHPTQKPLKLIKRFVELSTDIGDMVVDPFCGAGTIAKACDDLNRKCITTDINKEYIETAKNRVYGVNN